MEWWRERLKSIEGRYVVLAANEQARLRDHVRSLITADDSGDWSVDLHDMTDAEISEAIRSEGTSLGQEVVVLWLSTPFGVRLSLDDLAQHINDLWYPSADDLAIVSESSSTVVVVDHEEVLIGFTAPSPPSAT